MCVCARVRHDVWLTGTTCADVGREVAAPRAPPVGRAGRALRLLSDRTGVWIFLTNLWCIELEGGLGVSLTVYPVFVLYIVEPGRPS